MASDGDRGGRQPRQHETRRSISQKRLRDCTEDKTIVSDAKKAKKQPKVVIDLTSDSCNDSEDQTQNAKEQSVALARQSQEPGDCRGQPWQQQQHPTGNSATAKDGTSTRTVTHSSNLLASLLTQKDPLERRSLFSVSKEPSEQCHSLAPATKAQSHKTDSNALVTSATTKPVSTESQQKAGITRGPIKASMRGGVRGTPPPKRKHSESSQSSVMEAVLVPVISEDTHSNVNVNVSTRTNSQTDTSDHDSLTETDGTSKAKLKRMRCNKCGPCLMPDCEECSYCKDKGRYPKACKKRKDCVTWSSTLEATSHQGEGGTTSSTVQPTASSNTEPTSTHVDRSTSLDSESDMTNDDDESFQQLFDEAMEGCEVSVFIAKCGVTGPPGTGKSHLRAMILNKKRPVTRQSTAIAAEADQATPDWINFEEDLVEIDEMKDGSRVKWYMIDTSKMSGLAAKTMYRHQNLKHKTQEHVSSTTSVKSVRSLQSSTGTRLKFKVTKKIRKMLKELQRKANRKRKCLDKMKLIYLVDAGGQPQFQEIMPMFVRNSSVNILVHKLPEKLSERPTFDYEVDGTKFSVPKEMLVTNKEMIEQSVRSICSCNLTNSIRQRASSRPPKPFVAIVGMFKDKCSNRELEEKQVGIKECLAIYEKEKLIEVCRPSRDKPVFTFDASESGWEQNGEMLATLRTNIQQICESLEVKIPLRWFIFLEIFKEYSKGKNYISLQECYDIARDSDVHMSEDQVDKALQLFDELNMILHFSELLPNVVFCKPEFLFNKVSQMIVASFDCKQSVDIAQSEREQFRKTGVFSTELLCKTRHVFDDLNSLFTRDDLLDLLTNLCIVASLGNDRYFMPCVLPLESFESNLPVYQKYRRIMSDSGIEGPLFVSFGTEFTPRGLFCASIAYLAKLSSWIINPNHSLSDSLYRKRNVIELEFHSLDSHDIHGQTSFEGTVLIADRMTHFEVYSTCDKQHCPEIRKEIYLAFWHAAKSLSYDPRELDIIVGFVCKIPCGMPKPHGTAVKFRKESGATERCLRNCSKRPIPLAQNKEVWFNKVGTAPDSNPSTSPSLSLLMDEVASETVKWQNIGLQLELKHVDIQKINMEQSHKIDDCFRQMFDQWERRCTSPYTWKTVIEALEAPSVDEQTLARDLRRKYLVPEQGQNTDQPRESQFQQQEPPEHNASSNPLSTEGKLVTTDFQLQTQSQSHDSASFRLESGSGTTNGESDILPPLLPEYSPRNIQSTFTEDMPAIPKKVNIWQFILHLLARDKHQNVISWSNNDERTFQIHDNIAFTNLWAEHKDKPNGKTWKNVSTSIRAYYKKNILTKTGGRQEHTYQFSSTSPVVKEFQATIDLRLSEITSEPSLPETPQLSAMDQDEETLSQETNSESALEVNKEESQETETTYSVEPVFLTSHSESDQDEDELQSSGGDEIQSSDDDDENPASSIQSISLSKTGGPISSSSTWFDCSFELGTVSVIKTENSSNIAPHDTYHNSPPSPSQSTAECTVDLHSSIAETIVRGCDIIAENVFTVTSEEHSFQWKEYGFSLSAKRDSIPTGVTSVNLNVSVCASGPFELPSESCNLMSAVYWIKPDPPCEFTKPFTMKLEHCAAITKSEQLCCLTFVQAHYTQPNLPYTFSKKKGGIFTSSSGIIELTSFSGYGIAATSSQTSTESGEEGHPSGDLPRLGARCQVLEFIEKFHINQWQVQVIVVPRLAAIREIVQNSYNQSYSEYDFDIVLYPGTRNLSIPNQILERGDWKVSPCHRPMIAYNDIINFSSEYSHIPGFYLSVLWKGSGPPQGVLNESIFFTGEYQDEFFLIVINPGVEYQVHRSLNLNPRQPVTTTQQTSTSLTESHLSIDDLREVRHAVWDACDKWYDLGIELGVRHPTLANIEERASNNVQCLTKMLVEWLNGTGEATPRWRGLIDALNDNSVGLNQLARNIADRYITLD